MCNYIHAGNNTCEFNNCDHFCLLSSVGADGQSCYCQTGYILNEDQTTCSGKSSHGVLGLKDYYLNELMTVASIPLLYQSFKAEDHFSKQCPF